MGRFAIGGAEARASARPAALHACARSTVCTRPRMSRLNHALLAAVVVVLLAGCGVRRPEVALAGVHVGAVRLDGAHLNLRLDIHNPNRWAIDLRELTYQLSVDEVLLGDGETTDRFVVAGRDCATLVLPVDLRWRGVGRAGRELLTGEVEYRVVGHVRVGTPVGPITRRFDRTARFSPLGERRGGGPLCEPAVPPA